jgi:hypothetical protein
MKKSLVGLLAVGIVFVGCSSAKPKKTKKIKDTHALEENAHKEVQKVEELKLETSKKIGKKDVHGLIREVASFSPSCKVEERSFYGETQLRVIDKKTGKPMNSYWYSPGYIEYVQGVATRKGLCH